MIPFATACFAQTPAALAVANYAGFTGTFPVAPGSLASAYGSFGNIATTSAPTLNPMPKDLAGIRLRVNNVDAPLYFVSSGQINFVVPAATPEGAQTVQVLSGANVIASGRVNVWPVGPGLASSNPADPTRPGIIQNQNFSINSSGARAARGSILQVYSTGCGATEPAVQDGVPPTGLSSAKAMVEAWVSVEPAAVQFAGAHPQFPGICQVNVVVPDKSFITGQVPVYITVNGIASNPVSVWIQ
jgi:uncharacterized protein (TIGR03437 family)